MPQHIIQPSLIQGVIPDRIISLSDQLSAQGEERAVAVGGARDAAALGLSTAHISPLHLSTLPIGFHENPLSNITSIESPNDTLWRYTVNDNGGKATFWVGSSLVRVQRPPKNELLRVKGFQGGGGRSYVSGFSSGSRLRLLRLTATLRRDCVPIFITLTYPGAYPDNPKSWKRHLDTMCKRVRRRFPDAAMLWKLEPQKRGAPHYHMLMYGVYQLPDDFRLWFSEAWYKVVGSGDERHLRAGTRIEYLRSHKGAMAYAAKYMDKTVDELPEAWGKPGRFWGVVGRDNLPVGEIIEVPVTWSEACILQRWLRNYAKLPGRDRRTETIFVNVAERWLYALDGLSPTNADERRSTPVKERMLQ